MEKWEQFWADIAKEIEGKYGRDPLSTWENSLIEEFSLDLEKTVKPLIKANEDVAKACGVASEINNWESPSSSTFKRIFKYKNSKSTTSTRNCFAIYLGYRSAEDFIQREINKETLLPDNLTPKLHNDTQKPVAVVSDLQDADFEKEAKVNEWMVYELAFLWHGKEPPGVQAHFYAMTREIEKTKVQLHRAVEKDILKARTEVSPGGLTRYVTRDSLLIYIQNQQLPIPEFLN